MRRAPGLRPRDVRGCPRMSADVRGLLGPSIGLCLTEHVRAAKTMCSAGATHVGPGFSCPAPCLDPYTLNPKPSYQNPSRADGGNLAVPQLPLEQGSLPTPPARATLPAPDERECAAGGCENGMRKSPFLANGRRSYKIQFCENLIGLRSTYNLLLSYL